MPGNLAQPGAVSADWAVWVRRMMGSSDEYRERARTCRSQAQLANRPEDRAAWLKMAEDWEFLAENAEFRMRPRGPVHGSNDDEPGADFEGRKLFRRA